MGTAKLHVLSTEAELSLFLAYICFDDKVSVAVAGGAVMRMSSTTGQWWVGKRSRSGSWQRSRLQQTTPLPSMAAR